MNTIPSRSIWLIIRGICGNPDDCQEWEQRAADWIQQNTTHRARCDSYRCSAVTVWVHEKDRAQSFSEVLLSYAQKGFKIFILGHSNGTRVALEGMKLAKYPRVEELHLVCGACDSNFWTNGLNPALRDGNVGLVVSYRGKKDWAMKFEDTVFGKLLFGIAGKDMPLGLCGPRYALAIPREGPANRVQEIVWDDYGHSTCWNDSKFESTMQTIVGSR